MQIKQRDIIFKDKEDLLRQVKHNNLLNMITLAERELNPLHYQLSFEAKKRLRWLYTLYYEEGNNVTKASNRLGISRPWLSYLKSVFEKYGKDPRKLEPKSKAPHNTNNRNRISKDTEKKILMIRKDSKNIWGKVKISVALQRDYKIKTNPNTVNKYLHKHNKINPKISLKNTKAWKDKVERNRMETELRVKYRPPKEIKDLAPGALVEKDMKYIPKYAQIAPLKSGENFYNQHTEIDSFTRIRALEIEENGNALESSFSHKRSVNKFPFKIACINTDNGSENNGYFREQLQDENVFHFYSNIGTPTDNPRVERSHLTDELEFYQRDGLKRSFEEQRQALKEWEYFYNFKRPHQALGYLTPIEFYELWKVNPAKAYTIRDRYQMYLLKQRIRLSNARKIKKKEQIESLMKFIDAKLKDNKTQIQRSKLQLINCQLCSVA